MKFTFTGETMNYKGITLNRIQALKDLNNMAYVREGTRGGWIQKESNLSQEGACWVGNDAKVYGDAIVSEDAELLDDVEVFDSAKVCGDCKISEEVKVFGNAHVTGWSRISGNVDVKDNAYITDRVEISGWASVGGNVRITSDACISDGVFK